MAKCILVGKELILERGLKRLLDKRLIISVRKNLILERGLKLKVQNFRADETSKRRK